MMTNEEKAIKKYPDNQVIQKLYCMSLDDEIDDSVFKKALTIIPGVMLTLDNMPQLSSYIKMAGQSKEITPPDSENSEDLI